MNISLISLILYFYYPLWYAQIEH